MSKALHFALVVALMACLQHVSSFHLSHSHHKAASRSTLTMSELRDLQDSLFIKMDEQFNLKRTEYMPECHSWKEKDYSGSCEWYEEKMGSKLTGISKNSIQKGDEYESVTLNGWMGPAYCVPHLCLSIEKSEGDLSVKADLIVRGTVPIGTGDYVDRFYGPDVISWYDTSAALGEVLAPPKSFSARLLQSPVALSVGKLSMDSATQIADELVDKWLKWITDKEGVGAPIDSRQRGAMNSRDDKQRQYAYRSALDALTGMLGGGGKDIAAAFTGPIAEAYVGGGS